MPWVFRADVLPVSWLLESLAIWKAVPSLPCRASLKLPPPYAMLCWEFCDCRRGVRQCPTWDGERVEASPECSGHSLGAQEVLIVWLKPEWPHSRMMFLAFLMQVSSVSEVFLGPEVKGPCTSGHLVSPSY